MCPMGLCECLVWYTICMVFFILNGLAMVLSLVHSFVVAVVVVAVLAASVTPAVAAVARPNCRRTV